MTKMPGRDPESLRFGATKEQARGPASRQTPIVEKGRGAKADTGTTAPARGAKFEGPGKK